MKLEQINKALAFTSGVDVESWLKFLNKCGLFYFI